MWKEEMKLDEIFSFIDQLYVEVTGEEEQKSKDYSGYTKEDLEKMGFGEAQIEEILMGIEWKLPVQYYVKNCYNWKQMREIRTGLLGNLDIRMYDNELFSAEQMQEIRKGLQDHLNVSSYANLVLSAGDMERARKELLHAAYLDNPAGFGKEITDDGIRIRISDDSMQAFITLPEDRRYSMHELERVLNRNDIVYGISRTQLASAAGGNCGGVEILAAEGKRAETGRDGRFEYFFTPTPSDVPTQMDDGSVDYTQIVVADKRNSGDILAQYYAAEEGMDGETVTGIPIKGRKGSEKAVLQGQGIRYDEERKLYMADTAGYVMLDEEEGTLNVWDVYVVEGDINHYNGNITYDGIIHVKGSVGDMARIEASGNVVVEGYVEGAYIKAGGSIILQSGMNGCGRGVLEAGGSVSGRFFEAVHIYAKGDVSGNYFLNCSVETDRSLIAKAEKSRIVGGSVKAGYSVETCFILNSGRPATSVEVGNPQWIESRQRAVQEQLAKTEDELRLLIQGREKVGRMLNGEADKRNEMFHQICVAIRMKEEEAGKLNGDIQYYEQMKKRAKRAYVKVTGGIQAGVILNICGKPKKTEKDLSEIRTFRTAGI